MIQKTFGYLYGAIIRRYVEGAYNVLVIMCEFTNYV